MCNICVLCVLGASLTEKRVVSYATASFFFFFFCDFFFLFCDLKFSLLLLLLSCSKFFFFSFLFSSSSKLFLRIHSFVVRSLRARETTNNKGKIEKYARREQRRAFSCIGVTRHECFSLHGTTTTTRRRRRRRRRRIERGETN